MHGRTDCELEILYYNIRIILLKLDELYLLSPFILCALWKPDLMTLCWTMNPLSPVLSCKVRQEQTWWWSIVVIRDDLSHNVTLMILTTWNCHCTIVVTTAFVSVPCTVQLHHLPCFQKLFILCRKITFLYLKFDVLQRYSKMQFHV